jgi:hypothetical protein
LASHEVLGDDDATVFVSFEFEKRSIIDHRVDKPTSANNESENSDNEPNNLLKKKIVKLNDNLIKKANEDEKHNIFHQNRSKSEALLNICS